MKRYLLPTILLLLFYGCASQQPPEPKQSSTTIVKEKQEASPESVKVKDENLSKTLAEPKKEILQKISFSELPASFKNENFREVLKLFKKNCRSKKTRKLYKGVCRRAHYAKNAKHFIMENFEPYQINNNKNYTQEGLLTGYYLASINASYKKTKRYKYPVYKTPQDLVSVDLSSIYPELRHYRLRGRVLDGKLVPYYTREESKYIKAPVLCYCDSKVDKFFLEIQGSGKVYLDNNSSMYIGYDNQNGHKYKAIGRYLIKHGELKREEVSMQSIREWLEKNPSRVDEVLNYNDSLVFSKEEGGSLWSIRFKTESKTLSCGR